LTGACWKTIVANTMKLKRINGRYLVKTQLSRRSSHDELIVADSSGSSRLQVLNLWLETEHEPGGAFERYNRLRSLVCPSLVRPGEFHRVLSLDGRAPEGEGWLYTRPYVPGGTLEHHLEALTPNLLMQYLETDLYLSRAGHGLGGVPLDALVVESGAPRLRLCDLTEEEDAGLMDRVAGMVRANAEAGGGLSELNALIRDGKTSRPEHLMKYLTESFRVNPVAQFVASLPSRMLGYHGLLMQAATVFIRSAGEPPVVVIREGRRHRGGDMIHDLLARAEARGWFSMVLGNAGVEDLDDFVERRLSERLRDWNIFSETFSPTDTAADMLVACADVHPICLCMTLRRKHQDQLPELVEALKARETASSVALVVRLHADALPGRVELPGCTIRLDEREPPPAEKLVGALLAADSLPPGLPVTLERFGVAEPGELLPVIRYMILRRILAREGSGWVFGMSGEKAADVIPGSDIPLVSILRLEGLQRTALALLVHAGEALGARMVAHTVDADPTEVEQVLAEMEEAGFVTSTANRRRTFWKAVEGIPVELLVPEREASQLWDDRLIRFALSHPSPGLTELLAAIGRAGNEPDVRANLLYSALNIAGESGRSELIGRLLPLMLELPPDLLSSNQTRRILEVVGPRDLAGLDVEATRRVFEEWRQRLPREEGRTLADIRLAELDLMEGRAEDAGELIESAVEEISAGGGGGLELSLCLCVLSEMGWESGRAESGAETAEKALAAMPKAASPSEKTVILSRGALALSNLGRPERASELVTRAGSVASSVGPDAKQVWEWCRGRVMLAQGKLKPAVESMERALLLAENRGDRGSVAEMLGLVVMCQERLPGYTLRGIADRIESRVTRGVGGESSVYRYHSLARLYAVHIRSLRLERAEEAAERVAGIEKLPETDAAGSLMDWFGAFLAYQTGGERVAGGGDALLPGTSELLTALSEGTDPQVQARAVAGSIGEDSDMELVTLGLYLALETAARGWRGAARTMASALTKAYRPRMEEVIPAWRLCINGLLSSREREAEKSLASAQIMARQLDRLMLVWLILQTRLAVGAEEGPRRKADLRLLLEELDRHIDRQLPSRNQAAFRSLERVSRRRERLAELGADPSAPLPEFRDSVAESLRMGESLSLSVFSSLPEETPRTSPVSWGLEALRAFSRASRVQVVAVSAEEDRVLESRGFGAEVPPSPEALDAIRDNGGAPAVLDSYARTPFGHRFTHIIPLSRPSSRLPGNKRRRETDRTPSGNFLMIEIDSAFDTLAGHMGKILNCFARQISASLSLRQLEKQTYFNSMTGAVIRGVWLSRLREMLASWVGRGKSIAVLMIDLDYFKSVNDAYGHREGDRVLKAVVAAISSAVRPKDVVGRLGGEEFGVLLPSASEQNALLVAERVRRRVECKVLRPDRRPVTISVGAACAPAHGDSAELLVRRADVTLYRSKRSGRNRSTLWDTSMSSTLSPRGRASLLDTGDPGWDQLLGNTIMRMLASNRMSADNVADELRNALRCEYLSLSPGGEKTCTVGPGEIARSLEDAELGAPGKPRENMSSNWQYYTLGVKLAPGGSLLAAWRADDHRPRSLPVLFSSLAGLVEMLITADRLSEK